MWELTRKPAINAKHPKIAMLRNLKYVMMKLNAENPSLMILKMMKLDARQIQLVSFFLSEF